MYLADIMFWATMACFALNIACMVTFLMLIVQQRQAILCLMADFADLRRRQGILDTAKLLEDELAPRPPADPPTADYHGSYE